MLLTISTTARPATDLGWLLRKHPENVQRFDQSFGSAWVFYPEATEERCTAALMLEVDPVRLARAFGRGSGDASLKQYVNDRPYAASSLLAVALGKVFSTVRTGQSESRPELAAAPMPLEIALPAVPCKGGAGLVEELFAPLGWEVEAEAVPLPGFDADSRHVRVRLRGELRLADALSQLYVLLPVLDDAKHYWVDIGEVDKLVRAGGDWLAAHPRRDLITRRYLAHRKSLERAALTRLAEAEGSEAAIETPIEEDAPLMAAGQGAAPAGAAPATDEAAPHADAVADAEPHRTAPLHRKRIATVLEALREAGATSVVDLGCGSGKLLAQLFKDRRFTRVTGVDVAARALDLAERALRLDRMPERTSQRLELLQGSVVYRDKRFAGYDAAVLMEVVEHLDPGRLPAMERVVFGEARPRTVVVTTPNAEYNARYGLEGRQMRHADHRFEWDRARFAAWATATAERHGYRVRIAGVGDADAEAGTPTQMGVFDRD
ncbi:3' terminal RNA ribose 2'-O-methyltransferase Hen1 [Glycomyces sp. TRM65418]|uniref:3' terminal RNA ribose 2'-O-methyltransferase Hen1 n=1 Tax=Glycomyces sp. TRM65418 TaxID=2867006 RepID=UPI001CE51575|nr:3' terminal RNA ribose 2'-O-methyltransferase Hen1 [Glycomyces sp. TRM65418]MCC3763345.1 3' terminal RNA ribose 2'-O-methyltransferase Hen1 [Glycomyces sp. TRM65418]QZD57340.1 3' terminal RNA ribose 2'-O-methyltransferase Hen1 [Glycomyces sp. TRM65418]